MDTLRFLYGFCRPHWKGYLFGLALVPLSIASLLSIPYLTGEAVSIIIDDAGSSAPGGEGLAWTIGLIVAMTVARGATLFGTRLLIINASRDMEYRLRSRLFSHLLSEDKLFFTNARTGDLLTRLTSDVERARMISGPVVLYTSQTVCMLAIALPLMVSVSPILTVLLMVPLCLLTIAVRKIGPRVHERVFRAQEALSELSSRAQENFAGVRVVKSFAQEDYEVKSFAEIGKKYLQENLRAARIAAWMQPIVGGVGDLAVLSILLVGGLFILADRLSFEDFIKFSGYQVQLIWPMISIGWVINQYQRGGASVRRLRSLLAVAPKVTDPPAPRLPAGGAINGAVSIRGLTFRFGRTTVLEDVSIEVPRGSTVAIVGRTGSGKSTLVSLIPRIYPTPAGTIFIDGVDVNELPLEALRRAIGFVPQESFLFSRTLRQNMAFGVDDARDDAIWGVAGITRIDKDIDQLPRGYEEVVGERGVTLSGGQKQRTALSRALLVRPRILVLDDALSAVDTSTEEEILRNLAPLTDDLTTVIVAHRISSIKHADRIYVLEQGRVAEEGSHDELVALGGLYAESYRLQLISDELDHM